MKMSS